MKFIKVRFNIGILGRDWVRILDELQTSRGTTSFKMIYWKPPKVGWLKGNIHGASKTNPGPSFIAFYTRDQQGNLLVAQDNIIRDTTNLEAKAMAIRACLIYCRRNYISQLVLESDSWIMVQY